VLQSFAAASSAPLETYAAICRWAALIVAVMIGFSSLDDMFVDAWFWLRTAYRRLFVKPRHKPLSEAALYQVPEQPIAIMVPAWREDDVIAPMLANTIATLDYDNYVIFVGTYPNDPDTIREVERVRRRHKRVVRVEVPHGGPTCKADCLNAIVETALQHEAAAGQEFAGFILHDCEDVLHPVELRFFNYLLPRKDLIQLPVVSLERGFTEWVAGTYMDEFAEWHAKDLVVRESLARAVPSAGVGTCFSRRAIAALCETGEAPFNTDTLTEDYDIGARLMERGMSSIIAHFPVEFRVRRRGLFGGETTVPLRMPLCVREFFPNTFRTSYRQKARWILGIALQGWQQLGWSRSMTANYFMMRDRKALITPTLSILSYLLLINFLALRIGVPLLTGGPAPELYPADAAFAALLVLNGASVALRISQRLYFVNRLYGWQHALLSIPRMVVGAFVNCWATARAIRLFAGSLMFGTRIAWDKTMHHFPTDSTLQRDRRPLGEILASWEAVRPADLDAALAEQAATRRPLGRILMAKGWLDEETLAEAIATQSGLARAQLSAEAIEGGRGLIPESLAIRARALPIGRDASGAVVLAVSGPLNEAEIKDVAAQTAKPPIQKIVRESELAAGLRLMRGDPAALDQPTPKPLLGDILIDRGHVRREAFEDALRTYQPERHGRIGDLLVNLGVITREALADAIAVQKTAVAA